MAGKFARSWALSKQAVAVLKHDKQLMIFPILSAIAALVVLASFALPIWATIDFHQLSTRAGPRGAEHWQIRHNPAYYALTFAFYLANYFVIAFFNSALLACVMNRFDGKDTTVGAGLRAAAARLPQILGWALLSATVGMVLRALSERAGVVAKIVISLVGFVWTVATYFVVPVLVVEGVGPIEAVKRSAEVIRKTWGESLVTNIGLGALSTVVFLIAVIPTIIGVVLTGMQESAVQIIIGGGITVLALILWALISSTLSVILQAALYRYAATGMVPDPFNLPTGCVFHPRCPFFMPGKCDKIAPKWSNVGEEHWTSCLLYEQEAQA